MLTQSLNLETIVDDQASWANILIQPLGLFIFFVAGLAELGRTPFDIHHAESEVIGGPFIEYSGAHWSVFFLAEYINTFTISVLVVLLFLGGWRWPEMPFDGALHSALSVLWLLVKTYLVVLVIIWIRGTYPRLRIDQLMAFGWQVLVPLSFVNIVITGIALFYGWPLWALSLMSLAILGGTLYGIFRHTGTSQERMTVKVYPARDARRAPPSPQPETGVASEG
jgi:NADH-quinone oxidoreductase subunit H